MGEEGTSAGPSTKRSRSSGGQANHSFLPPWVVSASESRASSSYTLNTSMPSLEGRFHGLKRWVPELKKTDVAHISGGCVACPCMALSGKKVVHSSNGTYVAVLDGVVYANCSDRSCTWFAKEGEDMAGDEMKNSLLVEGSEAYGHPWVKYTEESYTRIGKTLVGMLHMGNKKAMETVEGGDTLPCPSPLSPADE